MRGWVLVTAAGLWLGAPIAALAQPAAPPAPRTMVAGHVGFARAGSGKTVTGEGLELGATISVRPFAGARRVALEAGFGAFRDPRDTTRPDYSDEMSAQLFVARALYTFRREDARTRPFLAGGLAVIHIDYESRCVDCVFDVDPFTGKLISRGTVTERIADTKAGFTVGTGVDIRVTRTVTLRSEWSSSSTTPARAGTGDGSQSGSVSATDSERRRRAGCHERGPHRPSPGTARWLAGGTGIRTAPNHHGGRHEHPHRAGHSLRRLPALRCERSGAAAAFT